jgi:hypothetical protein
MHRISSSAKTLAALSLSFFAFIRAGEATAQTDTYTWSAELVAFDKASNTVTVKSRIVEHADAVDLDTLKAGDRAMLTWSGLTLAAGVRALERGTESSFDRMTMPVEYVASELDGRYVVFKVPIPADGAAAIEELQPGAWVTATSPYQASNAAEAVRAIRPYSRVG